MYQLTKTGTTVIRISDGASIPTGDHRNRDCADYLAWRAAGNAPLPAEQPSHNEQIDAQIRALEASVTERRKREALLTDAGRAWLAGVDAQIAELRAQRR